MTSYPSNSETNPILDHIASHRSVRSFKQIPIPQTHIRSAVAAGQAASSSSAIQAYSVLQVTDPAARSKLVEFTCGQPFVESAATFLVICGDTRRHRLIAARESQPYDAHLEGFLIAVIDAALFAQNMALAFESMGYGICFIGGLRSYLPQATELLSIPQGIYPLFGLCVGVPADTAPTTQRPRLPIDSVLHVGKFHSDAYALALIDTYDADYSAYLTARGTSPAKATAAWSAAASTRFREPARTELADYYTSMGANLT